jgi:small-conductance mechanosensitive channel
VGRADRGAPLAELSECVYVVYTQHVARARAREEPETEQTVNIHADGLSKQQYRDIMGAIDHVANKLDYLRGRFNTMSDRTEAAFIELGGKLDQVIGWAQAEEQALRDRLAAAETRAAALEADDTADAAELAAAQAERDTLQASLTSFEDNVLSNIATLGTKVEDFGGTTGGSVEPAPEPVPDSGPTLVTEPM